MDHFVLDGGGTATTGLNDVDPAGSVAFWNVWGKGGKGPWLMATTGRSSHHSLVDRIQYGCGTETSNVRGSRDILFYHINLLWSKSGSDGIESVLGWHPYGFVWESWSAHHSCKDSRCNSKALQWHVTSTKEWRYIGGVEKHCTWTPGERRCAARFVGGFHGHGNSSTGNDVAGGQPYVWVGSVDIVQVAGCLCHRGAALFTGTSSDRLRHDDTATSALPLATSSTRQGLVHHPWAASFTTKSINAGSTGKWWDLVILACRCLLCLHCRESTAENLSQAARWFGTAPQWTVPQLLAACISLHQFLASEDCTVFQSQPLFSDSRSFRFLFWESIDFTDYHTVTTYSKPSILKYEMTGQQSITFTLSISQVGKHT